MPRPARVWYRTDIGWWMVTLGGVKTRLVKGPDDDRHRELAEEKFVEIRKLRREAPEASTARAADLVEAFLAHSRIHFAADTHRINRYYCQLMAEAFGEVPAREVRPFHVARWVDPKVEADEWGETTVYNARKCAFRVFSWAAEQGLLPANPLRGMPRPKPRPRQRAITPEEFAALYDLAGDPLRDYLLALYLTGARPKEVRDLTWPEVRDDRWVIAKHKTAKKVHADRVVFLPSEVRQMMARLRLATGGVGHVFLNTVGNRWTMNAVRLQISRLRKKAGLADDLCAYLCRHGFGTRAVLNGVDGLTLAHLMGHTSPEMISKVYVHLADQHKHLADAVERVSGASPTPAPAGPGPVRKRARGCAPDRKGGTPPPKQAG
jgi:integrase